jgi:hypothetical protein
LLIISTTREVKITAVSYKRSTGFKLYRTDMTTNTAGVNMVNIIGTSRGRVFMLGRDGNVWELDYRVKYYMKRVDLCTNHFVSRTKKGGSLVDALKSYIHKQVTLDSLWAD